MQSNKLNSWLTLGANIGVLIGIILLVVELDQNREMIRAQTRNDISQQLASRLLTLASNSQLSNVTRRAAAGEEISEDEERQAYLYTSSNLRDWENMHYQYRHGMFDESEFEAEKTAWRFVINRNKLFPRVWCTTRQNYSPEFVAEIENTFDKDICATSR
jgi:hypothetical protein